MHTFAIKDKTGKRIKRDDMAEAIAEHLAENTWTNDMFS